MDYSNFAKICYSFKMAIIKVSTDKIMKIRNLHRLRVIILPGLAFFISGFLFELGLRTIDKPRQADPGYGLWTWNSDTLDRLLTWNTDHDWRDIYSGHPPYIDDSITDFLINASPCIESYPTTKDKTKTPQRPPQYYDALFIICSDVYKVNKRDEYRKIYHERNTAPYKIKLIFLVGKPLVYSYDDIYNETLLESEMNGDLVMGNFYESYDNLTYKTVMGWRWASTHCPHMDLVLKIDDDVFVDVFKFMEVFKPLMKTQTRTLNCLQLVKSLVLRVGKYRVTEEEVDNKTKYYTEYCSGFFVVPSPDLLPELYHISKVTRFFRMEDIFMYGYAREAMVDVQLANWDMIVRDHDAYFACIKRFRYDCSYLAAHITHWDHFGSMSNFFLHYDAIRQN